MGDGLGWVLPDRSMGSWLLAEYLIPGCVGKVVKLGSESSSGGGSGGGGSGGGVYKSGDLKNCVS